MRKTVAALIFGITASYLFPSQSLSATKVFEREYTYQASEADSKLTCRTIALEQVKRLLLEELGTYLESYTDVKNFRIARDEIITMTAGIVRTEIVSEDWNGQAYLLRARIESDPDRVIQAIDDLRKDRDRGRELVEARAKAERYLKEIERLQTELAKAQERTINDKYPEYEQAVKKLSAKNSFERGTSFHSSQLFDDAIKAFTQAVNADSQYAAAYFYRGLVWEAKLDFRSALADFQHALNLDPDNMLYQGTIAGFYYDLPSFSPATQYPGTEEGAKRLLIEFLKPNANYHELGHILKPTEADYREYFIGDAISQAMAHLPTLLDRWEAEGSVISPQEGQTRLRLFKATTDELKSESPATELFPGGYRQVSQYLRSGLTLYRFKFVKPGETIGMAFDGLTYLNGHWVIFPKPWRYLR